MSPRKLFLSLALILSSVSVQAGQSYPELDQSVDVRLQFQLEHKLEGLGLNDAVRKRHLSVALADFATRARDL